MALRLITGRSGQGKNGISGAGSNPPFHGESAAEILCNRTRAVQS